MSTLNSIDFGLHARPDLPYGLQALSRQKRAKLAQWPLPTRKTESWKYSAKRLGFQVDISSAPANQDALQADYQSAYELDCYTLLLGNNSPVQAFPEIEGLTLTPFDQLSEEQSQLIADGVITSAEHLMFADANAAYMQTGLFIELAANQSLAKPLKIVFLQSGTANFFPRVFLKVGQNASMTLVEESSIRSGLDEQALTLHPNNALLNSVTDIHIAANARLCHVKMNLDQDAGKHIASTGVALMRDARFQSHCLAIGNHLNRHDLLVNLLEPGAECDLNGVCITSDKQHVDSHTCIEHIAANCTSNENYRCIADDQSQIVFNGRIHIHPHAQKTLGFMSNKNLLLSSQAEIDAKPELEIYADDVKCAHGTTIGQLDATEMYYLQTRGISREHAKLMLTLGFVLEIVKACPVTGIADFWEQTLIQKLGYQA